MGRGGDDRSQPNAATSKLQPMSWHHHTHHPQHRIRRQKKVVSIRGDKDVEAAECGGHDERCNLRMPMGFLGAGAAAMDKQELGWNVIDIGVVVGHSFINGDVIFFNGQVVNVGGIFVRDQEHAFVRGMPFHRCNGSAVT
eukprot:scaffold12005_cov55-Attheya_sp.AAC.1